MGFKNLKEYLQCYLTSDITLLADVFLNFRNTIFNQFELDCCKYISAPSLSKDCALNIQNVKSNISKMFQYFNLLKIL